MTRNSSTKGWIKLALGLVLGLPLAIAILKWVAWFGPGGLHAGAKNQWLMWMLPVIWMTVIGGSLVPKRTWLVAVVLCGLNIVTHLCWYWLR